MTGDYLYFDFSIFQLKMLSFDRAIEHEGILPKLSFCQKLCKDVFAGALLGEPYSFLHRI